MQRSRVLRFAPAIPYVAVIVGLYGMRSAWAAILIYHALAVAAIAVGGGAERDPGRAMLGWRPLVALNLAVGIFTGPLIWVLWPMLGVGPGFGARIVGLGITSWTWFALYYCLVNPAVEEGLWRAQLASDSPWPTLNDALFAGYHMLVLGLFVQWWWLPVAFLLLTMAGWIWRMTAGLRHGIALAVLSHLLADMGIILAAAFYSARSM